MNGVAVLYQDTLKGATSIIKNSEIIPHDRRSTSILSANRPSHNSVIGAKFSAHSHLGSTSARSR